MARLTLRLDFGPGKGDWARQDPLARSRARSWINIGGLGAPWGCPIGGPWLLIDELNRLFEEPVTEAKHGGQGGGGRCAYRFSAIVWCSQYRSNREQSPQRARCPAISPPLPGCYEQNRRQIFKQNQRSRSSRPSHGREIGLAWPADTGFGRRSPCRCGKQPPPSTRRRRGSRRRASPSPHAEIEDRSLANLLEEAAVARLGPRGAPTTQWSRACGSAANSTAAAAVEAKPSRHDRQPGRAAPAHDRPCDSGELEPAQPAQYVEGVVGRRSVARRPLPRRHGALVSSAAPATFRFQARSTSLPSRRTARRKRAAAAVVLPMPHLPQRQGVDAGFRPPSCRRPSRLAHSSSLIAGSTTMSPVGVSRFIS